MKRITKVIDKAGRRVLIEGRDYGLGFAFGKNDGEGNLTLVMPISACKDYLNDIIYSEKTGNPFRAYGLSTSKQNIFGDFGYLAIKVLPKNYSGGAYAGMDKDIKNLEDNHLKIQESLNKCEETLKIEGQSVVYPVSGGVFVVEVPKFWLQWPYLISLYSLIIRVEMSTGLGDAVKSLLKPSALEASICQTAHPKLVRILAGALPEQSLDPRQDNIHGTGIVGFSM